MTNHIKVTFNKDFKPYGIKAGATREVSENVAHKLLEVYNVIDDPFNQLVKPGKLVNIRLLAKMNRNGWYPYSEHIVTGKEARELIGQGLAQLADESLAQEQSDEEHYNLHSSFCYLHPNIKGIAWWLNSPHNFENDTHRINAISLAVQCSQSEAYKIFQQIKELEN